jgi:hypothetical protein
VSDICPRDHHYGCLTVDRYMDESYTLAAVALDYITSRGINDLLFIAYFGAGLNNSTLQTDTFSVWPGYPDSSTFLIASQLRY